MEKSKRMEEVIINKYGERAGNEDQLFSWALMTQLASVFSEIPRLRWS